MLASLVGFLGDFDLAEEAVQEAFAIAAERWPRDGAPENPGAWLVTTARHRAIDRLRRERRLAAKTRLLEVQAAVEDEVDDGTAISDERLSLIFMCCHPGLATEAQVALTLRALGGLSTEEIARAFLVSAETMKRRLSRAKAKIKTAGIRFGIPPAHSLPERLAAVLAVVYLIFNEGYGGRADLAAEAIRLGGVLARLMPDEPEVHGLLALMLCHDARREARFSGTELVLLEHQDRARWDVTQIARARDVLERALALRGRGPYVLQAAIASLQTEQEIDWPQVARCTASLPGSRARRSSSSTAPSRSHRRARPRKPWRSSNGSGSRTTSICTRRAPSCCGVSAVATRPEPPTNERWNSPAASLSGGSSSAGSASSDSPAGEIACGCPPGGGPLVVLTSESVDAEEAAMSTNRTRSGSSPRWVLLVAASASFMVALDALVVTTALTTIAPRELRG